ncbi:MAG: DUF2946 family protein [Alphaproteobacteria bacterium]|nr:DUF2946 family protein [Alphaproteobacteria bacterium]
MFRLRSRFAVFYRFVAYVALLAMLVPMGTMLVHHPAVASAPMPMAMSMPGCDMGMQEGTQDKTAPAKAPAHKMPSCPICQSLHLLGGGFVPPDNIIVSAAVPARGDFVVHERVFFIHAAPASQGRPRAPPVSV